MFFSKRRIVSILTACAFTCTTAAAIAPSTAHASLLGAIIGTGIQAVQQKKELNLLYQLKRYLEMITWKTMQKNTV